MANFTLSPAAATMSFSAATPTLKKTIYPAPGQLVFNTKAPTISSVKTVGVGNQLYINGALFAWRANTFHIVGNIGSGWNVTFELEHAAGATIPKYRDEVILFWEGVRRFAGLVSIVQWVSRMGHATKSVLLVTCTGYQGYLEDVVVAKLYALDGLQGGVPSIIVGDIQQTKLAQFGITFTDEGNPPDLLSDQLFAYITAAECIIRLLSQCPGFSSWVDFNKRLHFKKLTGISPDAPFSITRAGAFVEHFSLTISGKPFRNRMYVLPSVDAAALRTDSFTGDGSTFVFITQYNITLKPIVTVNGTPQLVTTAGSWIPGWQVYYIPGNLGIFFASPPAGSAAITVQYPNPFPLAAIAEDTSSIATYGLAEDVFHAKNASDMTTAEAIGEGLLTAYSSAGPPQSVEVVYETKKNPAWLLPGMVAPVNWTEPDVSANFIVEEVGSDEIGLTIWRHRVVLRRGAGNVTETEALQAIRSSMRLANNVWPTLATMEIALVSGLALGLQANTYRFRGSGTLHSWDARFSVTPPTGNDIVIDLYLNGTTIFPSGNSNKIVIPAGSTAEQGGFVFAADPINYRDGDLLTMYVIQVGSINPGRNGLVHLNLKPNTAIPPA